MGASSFPQPTQSIIDSMIIILQNIDISTAGSTIYTVDGITANHIVFSWNFIDSNDDPIPDNCPPADITITSATNSVTITVANITVANCYMSPVFVLPVSKTPTISA